MKHLPPKHPLERKALLFTFDGDIEPGASITLLQMQAVEVLDGVDAAAASILDSTPLLLTSTRQVLQWVAGGLDYVDYGISCLVTDSQGGRHIATCRLPVRQRL